MYWNCSTNGHYNIFLSLRFFEINYWSTSKITYSISPSFCLEIYLIGWWTYLPSKLLYDSDELLEFNAAYIKRNGCLI